MPSAPGSSSRPAAWNAPPLNWWDPPAPQRAADPRGPLDSAVERHLRDYTTLGVLKQVDHEDFTYFEQKHLCYVRNALTIHWPLVQGGLGDDAKAKWAEILQFLELDRKSMWDLMLLAHQGKAGRTEANEILWILLSECALDPQYLDMSHKCTSLVGKARTKTLDRPPERHKDRDYWTWENYWVPRNPVFSPDAVPRGGPIRVYTVRGRPIPPPYCWRAPA